MKIFIFGANGMLGNYISRYLKNFYNIIEFTRKEFDIEENLMNIENFLLLHNLEKNDIIINCTGIIPQKHNNSLLKKYINVNTLFPLYLNNLCEKYSCKLIHITTDCVYSGIKGNYYENTIHDDNSNIYSISKSLGEKINSCIIRTSIIGEDKESKSLLGWIKSQNNKIINGYTTHYWNGVTCLQLSKIIYKIIEENLYWKGIRHIFSPKIISKYNLIKKIIKIYDLSIDINPIKVNYINRSLNTIYDIDIFNIPSLDIQLEEMKHFDDIYNIPIGKYNILSKCRFCNNDIIKVFKLGDRFPLAGNFLKNNSDILNEKVYPLSISMCKKCTLIQCNEIINPDILFKNNYFYYSSMIPMLVKHFQLFADDLANKYKPSHNNIIKIVEIGCNDGVLLKPLKKHNFYVIGVDPSHTVNNLIKDKYNIYNTYLDKDVCNDILNKHGKIDLFISSNSFAHINNMRNIMNCIKYILKDNGYAIIEVHYLKSIIDDLNFEFIYHEHMSYYSVTSLNYISKLFNMTVTNVEFTKMHGNSLRVYIKNNIVEQSENIKKILESEKHFNNIDTFINYSYKLNTWRNNFINLYNNLIKNGKIIYGYGASGRSNTFCNYCNIQLKYIIDDAKSKIGNKTPVYHSEIKSSDFLKTNPPDYILILAWTYKDDIIKKNILYKNNGGKFIIPLPSITII